MTVSRLGAAFLLWLAASTLPAAPPLQIQPGAAESTLRKADLRVASVAYRLALGGRGLCPQTYPLTGLLFHHLAEYEQDGRALMTARYGLDRGPGVLGIVEGSPAAKAGLLAGDVLVAVNDARFPSPLAAAAERKRKKWRPMLEAAEAQLEGALARGPADLLVLRAGRTIRLRLDSLPGCPARIRLARSTQVNAFASGRYVVMTTSMLDFIRSDHELAVVLGHELSHVILGHPSMRDEDGLLASFGINANSIWRREEQADRLGLRLMAAAGYDLSATIPFWRRYLKRYDWFPQIFRSHPSLGAREKIALEEIEAIERERRSRP